MRVVLAAVRAAVRIIGTVRTIGAFVSAVHSSVTLPLEPVSTPSAFTTGVVTTFSGCVASLLTRTV